MFKRFTSLLLLTFAGTMLSAISLGQSPILVTGSNAKGQLGNGTVTDRNVSIKLSGYSDIVSVAAGWSHSLAVRADGTVLAWGLNDKGQLGLNDIANRNVPTLVPGLTNVASVAAGGSHSLALKKDGTVWSWGDNSYSQLGNGTTVESHVPVQVVNLSGVKKVAAGWLYSACLKTNGTVWTWGGGSFGTLGNNSTTFGQSTPVQASGIGSAIDVGCGDQHLLIVKSDGNVWTCGLNSAGQLGLGDTDERHVPTQVPGLTGFVSATGGFYFSVAMKANGEVWGWGRDGYNELGDGDTVDKKSPVKSLVSDATFLAAGYHTGLVIRRQGEVWGWGWNFEGELGNGNNSGQNYPVIMYNTVGATFVSSGNGHTMVIGSLLQSNAVPKFDMNGDGKTDLLLQNRSDGSVYYWLMDFTTIGVNAKVFGPLSGWKVVGTPDFNNDGKPDVLLQNASTGAVYAWLLGGANGSTIIGEASIYSNPLTQWKLVAYADLNHDGKTDLIFQNTSTGAVNYWLMGGANGTTLTSSGAIYANPLSGWKVIGIADTNGDGIADVILQNSNTGAVTVWLLGGVNGTTITSSGSVWDGGDNGWVAKVCTDLDNDGKADLVFQHSSTGAVFYWTLNGLKIKSSGYFFSGALPTNMTGWNLVSAPDLNNDGKVDLLFQNGSTGSLSYWLLSNQQVYSSGALFSGNLSAWDIVSR